MLLQVALALELAQPVEEATAPPAVDLSRESVAEAHALGARLERDRSAELAVWRRHVQLRPERGCAVAEYLLFSGRADMALEIPCQRVREQAEVALSDMRASPMAADPSAEHEGALWSCVGESDPLAGVRRELERDRLGLADAAAYAYAHAASNRRQAVEALTALYVSCGRVRRALGWARRAVSLGAPGEFLGRALLEAGRPKAALELFDRGGAGSGGVQDRVRALRALGRRAEATQLATEAYEAAPMSVDTILALARAVVDSDPQRARSLIERAHAVDPTQPDALVLEADLFSPREIEPQLRSLAVVRPDLAAVALRLARVYADAGHLRESERWACAAGIGPKPKD